MPQVDIPRDTREGGGVRTEPRYSVGQAYVELLEFASRETEPDEDDLQSGIA